MSNSNDDIQSSINQQAARVEQGARNQLNSIEKQNQKQLENALSIKIDKNTGKGRFLGFEVPEYIALTINPIFNTVVAPLSTKLAELSYTQASRIAANLLTSENKGLQSHNIGKGAETIVRWGTTLLNPLTQGISAQSQFMTARKKLYKELKPSVDSFGIDYRNNAVLSEAHAQLSENWKNNLKTIIPDLLALSPAIVVGAEQQKKLWNKRDSEFKKTAPSSSLQVAGVETQNVMNDIKQKQAKIASERNKYISDNLNNPEYQHIGRKELKGYLLREFDTEIKPFIDGNDTHVGAHKPDAPAKEGWLNGNFILAAGGLATAAEVMKSKMIAANEELKEKPTALSLIQDLKEGLTPYFVEGRGSPDPSRIGIALKKDGRQRTVRLKDYVVEIFQQVERYKSKSEFAAGLLEQLKDSVDPIVAHLADGTLDANALIKLAGQDLVVSHADGKRSFKKIADIETEIHKLAGRNAGDDVKEEEFLAAFAEPEAIKNIIKENIGTLKGEERTVFLSLLPLEIAEHAGLKKDELFAGREKSHELIYAALAAGVLDLAGRDDAELVQLGLSQHQVSAIQHLRVEIEHGNMEAVKIAVDGKDKTVTTAVLIAGLSEQSHTADGAQYWAKRVEESKTVGERIKEIAEKAEEKPRKKADTIKRKDHRHAHTGHDKTEILR